MDLHSSIFYESPDLSIWKGRVDPKPENGNERSVARVFQMVNPLDLADLTKIPSPDPSNRNIALLGFKSDIGVLRNQGRPGAAKAPDAIRTYLGNLAWHAEDCLLFDAGNVIIPALDTIPAGDILEIAQQQLSLRVSELQKAGYITLLIGGGHEIAKPHYLGLKKAVTELNSQKRIGIVNIDAHIDMRESKSPNSGTSFLEIYQWTSDRSIPFDYTVVGVQPYSNTKALFDTAEKTGTNLLLADQMANEKTLEGFLETSLQSTQYVYLTICMDAIDAAYAPGVSAPSVCGVMPQSVLSVLRYLASTKHIIAADIAETNPIFDVDNRTCRLSARLLMDLMIYVERFR